MSLSKLEEIAGLRLIEKIATGGMGEIWLAKRERDKGFERTFAVKMILPHLTENREFVNMFLDEGRLVGKLDHPNICQINDLDYHDNIYYMIMEYVDGYVLTDVIDRVAKNNDYLPLEYCCSIVREVCSGLAHAHSATDSEGRSLNLIHRDVSPPNIMIRKDGYVKIIDFGVAKAATRLQETQPGLLKGKLGYMSPEQVMGEEIDHRSDIFALGVVLWEMLTSRRLFWSDNDMTVLKKVRDGNYPQPSRFRDNFPPALEWIVMKALAYRPDDRFQACAEMGSALRDFAAQQRYSGEHRSLARYMEELMHPSEPDIHPPAPSRTPLPAPAGPVHIPNAFQDDPWKNPTPAAPGTHILVVDDDPYVQDIVRLILEAQGHDIALANDGMEAVELATHELFDACLLDLDMPRKDGRSALVEIKRIRPSLPCVIQTANEDFSLAAEMGRLGAITYLLKPVRKRVLEAAILKALRSQPTEYELERDLNHDYPTFLAQLQSRYRSLPHNDSSLINRRSLLASLYEYTMAWLGSLAGASYLHDQAFAPEINKLLGEHTGLFNPSAWYAWIHLVGEAYRRHKKRMFSRALQNLTIEDPVLSTPDVEVLCDLIDHIGPMVGKWADRDHPTLRDLFVLLNAYHDTQWLRDDLRSDREIQETVDVIERALQLLLQRVHRLIDFQCVRLNGMSASADATLHEVMLLRGTNPIAKTYSSPPSEELALLQIYLFDRKDKPLFSLSPFAMASAANTDESKRFGVAFATQLDPNEASLYRCATSNQISKPRYSQGHPGQRLQHQIKLI